MIAQFETTDMLHAESFTIFSVRRLLMREWLYMSFDEFVR
jgi:hypothetical protein